VSPFWSHNVTGRQWAVSFRWSIVTNLYLASVLRYYASSVKQACSNVTVLCTYFWGTLAIRGGYAIFSSALLAAAEGHHARYQTTKSVNGHRTYRPNENALKW